MFLSSAWNKRTRKYCSPPRTYKIYFIRVSEYTFMIVYLVVIVEHVASCFPNLFLYIVEYFRLALYQITIPVSCRNTSVMSSHSLKHQCPSIKAPGMSWNLAIWEQRSWRVIFFYYRNLKSCQITLCGAEQLKKIPAVSMLLICTALEFYFLSFQNYISVLGICVFTQCSGASYPVSVLHRSSCWTCND